MTKPNTDGSHYLVLASVAICLYLAASIGVFGVVNTMLGLIGFFLLWLVLVWPVLSSLDSDGELK